MMVTLSKKPNKSTIEWQRCSGYSAVCKNLMLEANSMLFSKHMNTVSTAHLTVDEGILKSLGNDWYLISIALARKVDYIVTWENAVIAMVNSKYAHEGFKAVTPTDFHAKESQW